VAVHIIGVEYRRDPYTCRSCPSAHMKLSSTGSDAYTCVCDDGYILVGDESIGPQACLRIAR
jgi:hypothetical protein